MLRLISNMVVAFAALGSACMLSACGADSPYGVDVPRRPGFDAAARQELVDLGIGKYLGKFTPSKEYQRDDETTFEFAADPTRFGPICFRGDPFRVSIRDTGSRHLLIYLQGGGACWSALCSANVTAGVGVMPLGWTDGNTQDNPLGDYNVVFIDYCDASVFSGDNDFPDAKYGGPDGIRHHHGLANLSAGVDIALEHFPNPDKIVLAGSSAGGYGTLMGTEVVRLAYPHKPLYVINDAGVGLTTPSIFEAAKKEWKFSQYLPPSCTDCTTGHLTAIMGWALKHDPSLRIGVYSSYHDAVIGGAFLQMDTNDFKTQLLKDTGAIHQEYPRRFERFFETGSAHTALIGFYGYSINGVTIPEWTERMIDNRYGWPDLLAKDE